MLPAQLTSSNLHDPILPFVSRVPVALRTTQTLADAHAAIRSAFPVADDGTLAGTVSVALFNNQVLSVAQETYNEIFQLLGVHVTSMRTPWTSYLDRFPWLLPNELGGARGDRRAGVET